MAQWIWVCLCNDRKTIRANFLANSAYRNRKEENSYLLTASIFWLKMPFSWFILLIIEPTLPTMVAKIRTPSRKSTTVNTYSMSVSGCGVSPGKYRIAIRKRHKHYRIIKSAPFWLGSKQMNLYLTPREAHFHRKIWLVYLHRQKKWLNTNIN